MREIDTVTLVKQFDWSKNWVSVESTLNISRLNISQWVLAFQKPTRLRRSLHVIETIDQITTAGNCTGVAMHIKTIASRLRLLTRAVQEWTLNIRKQITLPISPIAFLDPWQRHSNRQRRKNVMMGINGSSRFLGLSYLD